MHSTNEYIVSPDSYSPHKSPKGYSPHNSPTKEYSPTKEVGSYNEYNPGKSKSKLDYNPSKKSSKKDYTPSNNEYSPSSKQSSKYKPSTSSSKKKNYMVDSNYDNMKLKKKKQQNAYNLSSSSEDDIIGYKPQSKLNEESGSTSSNSLNSSYENPLKIKKKEKHSSKKSSKKSSKPNSNNGMSFADMLTSVPVVKKPKKRKLPPSNVKEERPGINQLQKAMSEMSRNLYTNPAKKEKKLDANEMTDMEAAALHSSRKKGRTLLLAKTAKTVNKVYTLYDICLQYLSNNIDKNEELISSTHELWEKHCKKEFRNKIKSKNEFQEWRELYFELCEERDRKLERLKKKIKKNTVLHEPAGKRTKMAFTGIGDAKAPRNIRKAQERNGTGKKN